MIRAVTWIASALFVLLASREWRARRRLRHLAREQERCRGRPLEPISEESYTARLMGTVFASVLYQVNPGSDALDLWAGKGAANAINF